MVLLNFSSDEMLYLGLRLCGFSDNTINRNPKTNEGRFKDKYYACPQTVKQLFDLICNEDCIPKAKPSVLLLTLFYLKKYPTKKELAGFLDQSEKTAIEKVARYIKAIQSLKERKIRWIFDDDSCIQIMQPLQTVGPFFNKNP